MSHYIIPIMRYFLTITLGGLMLGSACKGPTEPTVYPPFELRGNVISYIYDGALWAMELESGKTQMITEKGHPGYRWSRDGTQIAIRVRSSDGSVEDSDIAIIKPTGEEVNRVTRAAVPRWSPGGDSILHRYSRGIIGLSGLGLTDLDLSDGDQSRDFSSIVRIHSIFDYSPSSNLILISDWTQANPDFNTDLAVPHWFNLDTNEKGLLLALDSSFHTVDLRYSPDGSTILFEGLTDSDRSPGGWPLKIYLVDADGGNVRMIFETVSVDLGSNGISWSPDGRFIIFHNRSIEEEISAWIYKLNIGSGLVERLIEGRYAEWRFISGAE